MNSRQNIVLQDLFLNQARKERLLVTIHLTNGYQLRGVIRGFDSFVVILESEGKQMMIYKHALSSITPSRAISLSLGDASQAGEDSVSE